MGLYKLRKVDREIPKRANTTKISTPVMAAVAPHNWMPPCKQPWYFVAITLKTTNNSVIITPDHPLILDNTPLSMLFISSYHQSYGINVPKTHPRGSSRGSSYLLWLSISFGATTSVDRWYLAHKLTTTKHGRIFTVPSNLFHSKWLQWHKIVEQNGPTVSSSIILVSPRCRLTINLRLDNIQNCCIWLPLRVRL